MISKGTGKRSFVNDPYVKDIVEKVAYCYELHEALSFQIRRRVEQQVAYDATCVERQ